MQQTTAEVWCHASHTPDSILFTQVTQADSEQEVIGSPTVQFNICSTAVDISSMAYGTIG